MEVSNLRLRFEQRGHEISVPVLVLTPVLKVLEKGVELVVWIPLQVPVDANVPPVADLQVLSCSASICQERSESQCREGGWWDAVPHA